MTNDWVYTMTETERKRYYGKGEIKTSQGWNRNAYGSAEVSSTTMNNIFEAYKDYKNSENWY